MLTLRGPEMRSWLVAFFCHIKRPHPSCTLMFCFQSIILSGMYPRIFSKVFTWAKAHGYCGIEFVERGEHIWVFVRCCDNNHFRRVCVAVLDWFSGNVNEEVVMLGRIIDAIGPDVHVVSVQGCPHAPLEAYVSFLGSGY